MGILDLLEEIIFGKKNTGIITDGNFSVDAKRDIYLHNEKDITIHSKGSNKIFLNLKINLDKGRRSNLKGVYFFSKIQNYQKARMPTPF